MPLRAYSVDGESSVSKRRSTTSTASSIPAATSTASSIPAATSTVSSTPVVPATISAIPDLPFSASPVLFYLRQNDAAKAIKSAPPAIQDLTAESTIIDTSRVQFNREFEYFNARALSTILRNDMVNGQTIKYSPITNISDINQRYNPNNLISLQATLQSYFDAFELNLDKYTPVAPEPTQEYTAIETNAKYEIEISFADVSGTERVEVEFLVMDTAFNDTIYI
jgi:hypothetical protein